MVGVVRYAADSTTLVLSVVGMISEDGALNNRSPSSNPLQSVSEQCLSLDISPLEQCSLSTTLVVG